jgi:cell division protein FtsZ
MTNTVIKVLGLGGAGSNAVNRMIQLGIEGVEFIAANTDAQALGTSEAPVKILLGPRASRGLGAGGQPAKGEEAAEESANTLADVLEGADMVFLAAGLGGGTGTGAAPVAARMARETGALTVAVVTLPFLFEGSRRLNNAQTGLNRLKGNCDTLIPVSNDKLLSILPRDVSFDLALRVADEVLRQSVQGMAELVTRPGLINVDFANVKSLMQLPGGAFLSIGQGKGGSKAVDAVRESLQPKLLEAARLEDAAGVLVHFTGGDDLTLHEINLAMDHLNHSIQPEAQIVMGATIDPIMAGRAQAILVATGVGGAPSCAAQSSPERSRRVEPPARVETVSPSSPTSPTTLADTLFATARSEQPAQSRQLEWVVAEEAEAIPAPIPDNLDLPAFMRRRRLFTTKQ